jgi:hypothetical protein
MTTTTLRPSTRRHTSTRHRIRPHVPYTHPDVPGICQTCQLPIITSRDGRYLNDRHITLDELLAQIVTAPDVMALAAGERPYG